MLTLLLRHPALGARSDLTAGDSLGSSSRNAAVARKHPRHSRWQARSDPAGSRQESSRCWSRRLANGRRMSLLYRSLWSRRQAWRGLIRTQRVPSGEHLVSGGTLPPARRAPYVSRSHRRPSDSTASSIARRSTSMRSCSRPGACIAAEIDPARTSGSSSRFDSSLAPLDIGKGRTIPARHREAEATARCSGIPRQDLGHLDEIAALDRGIRRGTSRAVGPPTLSSRGSPNRRRCLRTARRWRSAGVKPSAFAARSSRNTAGHRRRTRPTARLDLSCLAAGLRLAAPAVPTRATVVTSIARRPKPTDRF